MWELLLFAAVLYGVKGILDWVVILPGTWDDASAGMKALGVVGFSCSFLGTVTLFAMLLKSLGAI